ncbi:hypothetical protein JOD18_001911 [Gracilibacillus alcaliphilus]|nr:hypothetical protein [Gracilibacillus alcaliphilus]
MIKGGKIANYKTLAGKVAKGVGRTRGAGRGITAELGATGVSNIVYITGSNTNINFIISSVKHDLVFSVKKRYMEKRTKFDCFHLYQLILFAFSVFVYFS